MNSVKLIREDFLRFILIAIICLVFASSETALLFGCVYGLLVLGLIVMFALVALFLWMKFATELQKARSWTKKRRTSKKIFKVKSAKPSK
jgi:uncharacterized membrane protein YedE/YeeE